MSEATIELLPCPFCGGTDISVKENYNPGVHINSPSRIISVDMHHFCLSEGLPRWRIGVTGRDYAEAAKAWNTRAALTDKQAAADVTDINVAHKNEPEDDGYQRLWLWFGLSRASFLTLPRVLMHAMTDDWQGRMAALLEDYYKQFPAGAGVDCDAKVIASKNGRFVKWPDWVLNYRHPDRAAIAAAEQKESTP